MHVVATDAVRLRPSSDRRHDEAAPGLAEWTADEPSAPLSRALEASGLIGLDRKTQALTRVAALIAIESCVSSYQWAIDAAIEQGASEEDLIDVLISVAPIVGLARATSAAPQLARLIGFECHARSARKGTDKPPRRDR